MLGGWALPGGLVLIAFGLAVTELLEPIRTLRSLFIWLGLAIFLALVLVGAELVARRNFVELAGDRIRWSFLTPPEHGDKPLADLVQVEVEAEGDARLVFKKGPTMVSTDVFRRRSVIRLVEALRAQGVEIASG